MRTEPASLAAIAAAILAGCCLGARDEERVDDLDGTIDGQELAEVLASEDDDDARCEAACEVLADRRHGGFVDEVSECMAEGDPLADDPWNADNERVIVECTARIVIPAVCMGRRPQGHREIDASLEHVGEALATSAHLERASVRAFVELADWLARRGAPAELVRRCRAAAVDEIDHAVRMTALAHAAGAEVPACEADRPRTDAFAVALHNAVEGCVHEAFAAIVVAVQARQAATAELRETFARIAADELAHGQLAWDVHAWLASRLSAHERRAIERARARALARLPTTMAATARAMPRALGWPPAHVAAAMAERFATLASAC
jgi:hypothetical protein